MAIVGEYSLAELESKIQMLPWQEARLSQTASGYGRKLTMTIMVKLPGSPRWRRVYCCIFSNIGTCYVTKGKDWIVIND